MPLLDARVVAETREILRALREPVRIRYFTQEGECPICAHTDAFLGELGGIEPRLQVERIDFRKESVTAAALGIHRVPAITLARGERLPVRYYGLPAGHEYGAFLRTLITFSTGAAGIEAASAAAVERETHLQVYVLHG